MSAYYNEWDAYAAQYLRNLIAAGLIAPGDVDERSIAEVRASDLAGYTQVHLFAGLGGWSCALRRAGWADDRPVRTASCPCQPFSNAGDQEGFDDERHLWPEVYRLLPDLEPTTLFGEQVAGASDWLALVRRDLESLGYAVGAMPIEAACAGADHFRDRYWFVADPDGSQELQPKRYVSEQRGWHGNGGKGGSNRAMADNECAERGAVEAGRRNVSLGRLFRDEASGGPAICSPHGFHRSLVNDPCIGWGEGWTEHEFRSRGFTAAVASVDDRQYVECPDGKWRRLPPPRVRWLGNGIPARVDKLRAFGNAIDPRPAAQFIAAYMECAE